MTLAEIDLRAASEAKVCWQMRFASWWRSHVPTAHTFASSHQQPPAARQPHIQGWEFQLEPSSWIASPAPFEVLAPPGHPAEDAVIPPSLAPKGLGPAPPSPTPLRISFARHPSPLSARPPHFYGSGPSHLSTRPITSISQVWPPAGL